MGIPLSGPQKGVVMVPPSTMQQAKPAVQPQAPPRIEGGAMRMNAAESSRLQKMLAKGRDQRSTVQKVGVAMGSGAPAAKRPAVQQAPAQAPALAAPRATMHHISREQVSDVLTTIRQTAGTLAGALTPHWKAYQTAILSGRSEGSPVLATADVLLGRMLLSITKLDAAEREGRGAMISDNELADVERAEELVTKL